MMCNHSRHFALRRDVRRAAPSGLLGVDDGLDKLIADATVGHGEIKPFDREISSSRERCSRTERFDGMGGGEYDRARGRDKGSDEGSRAEILHMIRRISAR
jgi:hypothetical protein